MEKSITIEILYPSQQSEMVSVFYMEGDKVAKIFIGESLEENIQLDKDVFIDIYNKMLDLDYAAILKENADKIVIDGIMVNVILSMGDSSLTVNLTREDQDLYSTSTGSQSEKFYELTKNLLDVLEEKGVKFESLK